MFAGTKQRLASVLSLMLVTLIGTACEHHPKLSGRHLLYQV